MSEEKYDQDIIHRFRGLRLFLVVLAGMGGYSIYSGDPQYFFATLTFPFILLAIMVAFVLVASFVFWESPIKSLRLVCSICML